MIYAWMTFWSVVYILTFIKVSVYNPFFACLVGMLGSLFLIILFAVGIVLFGVIP